MAQFKCLLLMVFVAVIWQRFAVADERATPIAATADPCVLGTILAVHYKSFGDDCGETVNLDLLYTDGKPSLVSFDAADQSKLYTLMMVDPDAPEAADPKFAYFLHWLIVNIQGTDLRTGVYGNGTELTIYQDPLPPLGSGLHRYQFFVFAQAGNLAITPPNGRAFFDVAAFMDRNSLTGPLAGYQFLTEEPDIGIPTTHSESTLQGPTGSTPQSSTGSTPQSSTGLTPQSSTGSTPQSSSNGSTPVPSPNDEATATSTTPAGAAILKGNWVMLVMLALLAVFHLAQ